MKEKVCVHEYEMYILQNVPGMGDSIDTLVVAYHTTCIYYHFCLLMCQ